MFFKSQPVRLLAVIGFALMTAATAHADVAIQHQGTSYKEESNTFAPLAEVIVGNADVHINGVGVFGQTSVATNVKWVIFDSIAPNAPAFLSAAQPITGAAGSYAASARWYDSPELDFTLLANHTYAMGILADKLGPTGFKWGVTVKSGGSAQAAPSPGTHGLSIVSGVALADAGLAGSFAQTPRLYTISGRSDPVQWSDGLQPSLRIMAAPIPEPREWSMMLAGLLMLGIAARRRRRKLPEG